MKSQRGSIQIPILIAIVASILVLGGAGYFGYKQIKNRPESSSTPTQDTSATTVATTTPVSEINQLKQEVEDLKKQVKLNQVPKPAPTNSLTSIIKTWRPRIALVDCSYKYDIETTGSGLLVGNFIDTNTHVFKYKGVLVPLACQISLPDRDVVYDADVSGSVIYGGGVDIAGIRIDNTDNYTQNLGEQKINHCKTKAEIGDSVVILGYPYTGSTNNITATEGIISGYDDWSYVTSAKIEHGNSGGAAILVKDNCYLGIPSSVAAGELESLGRILDGRIMNDAFYFERHGNGLEAPDTCTTQQSCIDFCTNDPVLCQALKNKRVML